MRHTFLILMRLLKLTHNENKGTNKAFYFISPDCLNRVKS